jgi:hypothetical protein
MTPHVRTFVKANKTDRGIEPEVVDGQGNPRVGDAAGNPMSILELVREMKTQQAYAPGFTGSGQSGTGKGGDTTSSGKQQRVAGSKVIPASDKAATSASLEDIAKGTATVDMDN